MTAATTRKDLTQTATETVTDDKNQSSSGQEDRKSSEEKAAATREDAFDISLNDHLNEVNKDAVTNPVEQAKKRARTNPSQGGFLASDGDAASKSIEDEQIALYKE